MTVPYGLFDENTVFVGREYIPADHTGLPARSVRSRRCLKRNFAVGASPPPYGVCGGLTVPVGLPLGVTVTLYIGKQKSGRRDAPPLRDGR